MEFGEKIKKARKGAGMTQKQLAEEIGVAEITIRKYEANKRTPSFVQLTAIAIALNVFLGELLPLELSPLGKKLKDSIREPYEPSDDDGKTIEDYTKDSPFKKTYDMMMNGDITPEEFEKYLESRIAAIKNLESKYPKLLDPYNRLTPESQQKILELIDFYTQLEREGSDSNG